MAAREPPRPGTTPIVRLDGEMVTYVLWIEYDKELSELVLRVGPGGGLTAAIQGSCKRPSRSSSF